MKRNYFYPALLAPCVLLSACQQNYPYQIRTTSPIGANQDLTITKTDIERPIAQAETKQLIHAMPTHGPLYVLIAPKQLSKLGVDGQTGVEYVTHVGENASLIFYLEAIEKQLLPALQAYYRQYPINAQRIPIQDCMDYHFLLEKTGSIKMAPDICTQKRKNWSCIGSPQNLRHLIFHDNTKKRKWYRHLPHQSISNAYMMIPAQQQNSNNCHINTSARALILARASHAMDDKAYAYFEQQFSKVYIKEIPHKNLVTITACMATGLGGGLLLFGIPAGLPLLATASTTLGGMTCYQGVVNNIDKIPHITTSPWHISEHLSRFLGHCQYKSTVVSCYNNFNQCLNHIQDDITRCDPCIILLFWDARNWHYVNVVGVSTIMDESQITFQVEGLIVLDTNSQIYEIPIHHVETQMFNQYKLITKSLLWDSPNMNYYIIRFVSEMHEQKVCHTGGKEQK